MTLELAKKYQHFTRLFGWLCQVFGGLTVGAAGVVWLSLCLGSQVDGAPHDSSRDKVQQVLEIASSILEESQASYIYGGSQVGDPEVCRQCASCLERTTPKPARRLAECPKCSGCGIDCSHFVSLVFTRAGLEAPYLDTSLMLGLGPKDLSRRYHLNDLGDDVALARRGDLLVYKGHVVILEKVHRPVPGLAPFRGDVIHATGGKDIKAPGQGIQRERFVELSGFRGPLLRILRHRRLD